MIRIKICCIQTVEEAQLAIQHSANLLGLVSEMPSGPGVIPEEKIKQIAATVPPGVTSTLLTSCTEAASILEQQHQTCVNAIQIVDRVSADEYPILREALPGIKLIQVIHVTSDAAIDEALSVTAEVDAILLDSGDPNASEKILGGTGRIHDWAISRRIVQAVTVPVFLAGGLTPENVAVAIHKVRPFGVDVCGGVRTNGQLDKDKLALFIHTARSTE